MCERRTDCLAKGPEDVTLSGRSLLVCTLGHILLCCCQDFAPSVALLNLQLLCKFVLFKICTCYLPSFKNNPCWGGWVAQSVKHPTLVLAQVMISWFCEFGPCLGLRADCADPAWDSLCPSISLSLPLPLPLPHSHYLFLCQVNK